MLDISLSWRLTGLGVEAFACDDAAGLQTSSSCDTCLDRGVLVVVPTVMVDAAEGLWGRSVDGRVSNDGRPSLDFLPSNASWLPWLLKGREKLNEGFGKRE